MNTTSEKVQLTTRTPTTTSGPTVTVTTTTVAAAAATATAATKFPTTQAQQSGGATGYRPALPPSHPNKRRHRQCCTCQCCFLWLMWVTLIVAAFLVLAAIPFAVFYFLDRPRPPSFSLSSLKITTTTSQTQFTSKLNLTIAVTNPNQKIVFYYDPINVTVFAHKGSIVIGQGSFPSFVHWGKNTTSFFAVIGEHNNNVNLDDGSLETLKSDMKNKKGLNLKVQMETQVRIKIGEKVKTSKVGLRASCDGIRVVVASKDKLIGVVKTSNGSGVKCKVHLIIKIFEWDVST